VEAMKLKASNAREAQEREKTPPVKTPPPPPRTKKAKAVPFIPNPVKQGIVVQKFVPTKAGTSPSSSLGKKVNASSLTKKVHGKAHSSPDVLESERKNAEKGSPSPLGSGAAAAPPPPNKSDSYNQRRRLSAGMMSLDASAKMLQRRMSDLNLARFKRVAQKNVAEKEKLETDALHFFNSERETVNNFDSLAILGRGGYVPSFVPSPFPPPSLSFPSPVPFRVTLSPPPPHLFPSFLPTFLPFSLPPFLSSSSFTPVTFSTPPYSKVRRSAPRAPQDLGGNLCPQVHGEKGHRHEKPGLFF
jgi:hypothetical protein